MAAKAPPIPKSLLADTVILKIPQETDELGEQSCSQITLSCVRVELDTKIQYTQNGITRTAAGALYYDCVHSAPAGLLAECGQKIEFAGREYAVVQVEQRSAFGQSHHWKAVLA